MIESTVLLLSDVVDSTQLAERLDMQQLAQLWEAHDHAARSLLREWGGREIDKSDGFLLLFGEVSEALGFAEAYHHALAQLTPPLKARVGIHIGPVMLRNNSAEEVARGAKLMEVEGPAKPLAARVMSLALGGQTLLSENARAALGDTAHRVQSHGHWRLKGLQAPIELFEVGGAQAPFTPPPDAAKAYRVLRQGELWLPVRELRHTLPAERDSFVGREPALQALAQCFEGGARLVSLLGIGGTGKTRLAQRFGWTWFGDFPGGVWFCDLSQATGIDGIVHAVAQGLELPLGKAEPVQQIGQAIAGRGACLVIVDNFEQVARHAEATVGQWLDRAAEARFLVTSREVLGIVGEHAMPLPPLPVADSVTLFMRRAVAAASSFQPVGDEAAAIEPLVKLLDGLPLAIELCAARARVMQPRALLQRMSERFKLLTSSGGRHDRQATLRATLDWSWDLLTEPERSALAQLSVFEGGFTLEAAEAVIDLSAFDDSPWVVDVIQSLLQKSLVRQVSDRRFELLRSVQDYAEQRLARHRETQGNSEAVAIYVMCRHWEHFASLDEVRAVEDRCVEADNLVSAFRRAMASFQWTWAAKALVATWAVLRISGPIRLAIELGESLASARGAGPSERAAAEWVVGNALFLLGLVVEAARRFERGLELAALVDDQQSLGRHLCAKAELAVADNSLGTAADLLARALTAGAAVGDVALEYRAKNLLAVIAEEEGRSTDAEEIYVRLIELSRAVGNRRWEGGLLGNLGLLIYGRGNLEEARHHLVEALNLASATGDRRWEGNARSNLGLVLLELGRLEQAGEHLEASLTIAKAMGVRRLEATVLCNLGLLAGACANTVAADTYFGQSVILADSLGDNAMRAEFRFLWGRMQLQFGKPERTAVALMGGDDLLMGHQEGAAIGALLAVRAHASAMMGQLVAAQNDLGRAEAIFQRSAPVPLASFVQTFRQAQEALAALYAVSHIA